MIRKIFYWIFSKEKTCNLIACSSLVWSRVKRERIYTVRTSENQVSNFKFSFYNSMWIERRTEFIFSLQWEIFTINLMYSGDTICCSLLLLLLFLFTRWCRSWKFQTRLRKSIKIVNDENCNCKLKKGEKKLSKWT